MNLGRNQTEKLKRYFINADPFLWGVLEARNKKGRLKEIRALGFLSGYSEGSNPTYSKINQDLLVKLGIEGILERIVVLQIRNRFAPEILRGLRRYWEQGRIPNKEYLKQNGLCRFPHIVWREESEDKRPLIPRGLAHIFVQINTQFNYVERWTVFAGLWFEEIEPWLDSGQENSRGGSHG